MLLFSPEQSLDDRHYLNPTPSARGQMSWSNIMGRRSGRSSNMSPGEYCAVNTLEMEAIAAVHEMRM